MAASGVPKLYRSVIEDVINNAKEAFLDDGVEEQVLLELKQIWEKKLLESKAIEPHVSEQTIIDHCVPFSIQQQPLQSTAQQILSTNLQPTALQFNHGELIQGGQKTLTLAMPQKVTIALPAQMGHAPLHTVMSSAGSAATLALPPEIVTTSLFPHHTLSQGSILNATQTINTDQSGRIHFQSLADLSKQHYTMTPNQPVVPGNTIQKQTSGIIQLDGTNDTSDDDDDDDEFHENDYEKEEEEEQNEDENCGEEEEPLNSNDDDDVEEDSAELFYTENVVVCQYDKITRSKNRWKFHLKDGIMNLKGKDYVFQKAVGDAEW